MKDITLQVEKRDETGRKVRQVQGSRIPAVVYGHGFEAQNVWVDATAFNRAFEQAGTSSIISVTVGDEKPFGTLVHDFQADPISNQIMHVDFFHVRMDEKVETHIPVVVTGESAAVKNLGGTLGHIESIAVRALPGDLVHEFTVDVSTIATFEERITIADLGISDAIEVLIDVQTPVASVTPPRTQAEVDAADDAVDANVSGIEDVDAKDEGGSEEAESAA